ncbi:MAG: NfeD family protein [Marmoricola sp.]
MNWIGQHMWQSWLIAAGVLTIVEIFSLDFVFLMFAVAALVAMLAALMGLPVLVQVIVAMLSALALLALFRPSLLRALHRGPELLVGPAALVGRRAHALSALSATAPGRVKIGGDEWTAIPDTPEGSIPAQATLEVVAIDGAMAVVRQVSTGNED